MRGDFIDKGLVCMKGSGPWKDVHLAQNTGHISILNMSIILPHHSIVKFLPPLVSLVSPLIAASISLGCSTAHMRFTEVLTLMCREFPFHTISALKTINLEQFLIRKGTIPLYKGNQKGGLEDEKTS